MKLKDLEIEELFSPSPIISQTKKILYGLGKEERKDMLGNENKGINREE